MPMGLTSGSVIYQRTTDALRLVMASKNVCVFNYIDDVITVHRRHNANKQFDTLHGLFRYLGIPVNPQKVVRPTKCLECMGIIVDVALHTLAIPPDKCISVLENVSMCTLTFFPENQKNVSHAENSSRY